MNSRKKMYKSGKQWVVAAAVAVAGVAAVSTNASADVQDLGTVTHATVTASGDNHAVDAPVKDANGTPVFAETAAGHGYYNNDNEDKSDDLYFHAPQTAGVVVKADTVPNTGVVPSEASDVAPSRSQTSGEYVLPNAGVNAPVKNVDGTPVFAETAAGHDYYDNTNEDKSDDLYFHAPQTAGVAVKTTSVANTGVTSEEYYNNEDQDASNDKLIETSAVVPNEVAPASSEAQKPQDPASSEEHALVPGGILVKTDVRAQGLLPVYSNGFYRNDDDDPTNDKVFSSSAVLPNEPAPASEAPKPAAPASEAKAASNSVKAVAKEVAAAAKEAKAVLPHTGAENNGALTALALLGLSTVAGAAVVSRRRG